MAAYKNIFVEGGWLTLDELNERLAHHGIVARPKGEMDADTHAFVASILLAAGGSVVVSQANAIDSKACTISRETDLSTNGFRLRAIREGT